MDTESFTQGEGTAAILFVHGFADKPLTFHYIVGELSQHFTCRAIYVGDASTWRETIQAEFEALQKTHKKVWLCGHSLGGALVLASQLDGTVKADGIVLLSPLVKVSRKRSLGISPRFLFGVGRRVLLTPWLKSPFSSDIPTADGTGILYHREKVIPFSTYEGLFGLLDDIRDGGALLNVPVFAALVEGDPVVDTPAAQRWLSKVTTQKRIDLYKDCSHALHLETNLVHQLCVDITQFITNQ